MKYKVLQTISACITWMSALELYYVLWQISQNGISKQRLVLTIAGLIVFAASIFAIGAAEKRLKDNK